MRRIRVLIVDDSTIIRRLITDALQVDPELEVIGTAANGKIALSKIDQLNPDVITMDIEMPEMNGIEAVTALRKKYPRLPVIMFSTLTSRGAEATLDALSAGANDYVTKPSNVGSLNAGLQAVRDQLIPKLKALCEIPVAVTQPATPSSLPSPSHPSPIHISRAPARPHTIEVVVIGVSTGGPNALAAVLPQIPANFHLPIVIVQHMPPLFTRFLAERLNNQCPLAISEAQSGELLLPGHAYIAPGDYHLGIVRNGNTLQLQTCQTQPENSCRPSVDYLFRSAAEIFGPRTLGVILTGMGQDGLRGAGLIHRAGGTLFAQDQATSVVWGMPKAVVHANYAHKVLPLHEIASAIVQRCMKKQPVISHAAT